MYLAKPGLTIGFHGCDQTICRKVASGIIALKPSTNAYDWLGHGVYFWENNRERAMSFASELKSRKKIRRPAALGAVLEFGFCLDLFDSEFISLVKQSYNTFVESYNLTDQIVPINRATGKSTDLLLRDLDCAVLENLHTQRRLNNLSPFDSVRGAFLEGQPLYPNAGFHEKTHIQICIRNPNCIKGYFIPREVNQAWAIP